MYFIVMNLPTIEFIATVSNCAYSIKLFANPTNPFASTPMMFTMYGVKKAYTQVD